MSDDLQAQFDRWAAAYDADVAASTAAGATGGHGFPFAGYDRVLARVVELAQIAPGMAVLELGPGTGNLTTQLVERGAAVWALDFSAEMLARARARVPAAHFAGANLLGDFPPDFHRPFDAVVSTYTFHEFPLPDKLALLRRLFASHLRPGGAVVIGDIGFPTAAARDALRAAAGDAWDDEHYWIMAEVEPALRASGLKHYVELIPPCAIVLTLTAD
ncbi:MAG: class I SAM-dependent methyltransferase [Candidatus Promineofilum sp.]|nr:class I SAM-dependent methyltransferase [Promineifilum sp.]